MEGNSAPPPGKEPDCKWEPIACNTARSLSTRPYTFAGTEEQVTPRALHPATIEAGPQR